MRQNLLAVVALAIAAVFPASSMAANRSIQVLFVYERDAFNLTSDHFSHSMAILNQARLTLAESGLTDYDYTFSVNDDAAVPFNASSSTTAQDVIDWMRDRNTSRDRIRALRSIHAADIVVMLVDRFLNSGGGPGVGAQAGVPSSLTNPGDVENVGYIVLDENVLTVFGTPVAGHELGHALFAQHELADDGVKPNQPVPYNHAVVLSGPKLQTAMASNDRACGGSTCTTENFYSENGRLFPGTTHPAGNAATADNKRIVQEQWDLVSLYRSPIPATFPNPQCDVFMFGCSDDNRPQIFVSFDDPFGLPVNSFVAQKKNRNGTWSHIGTLFSPGCVATTVSLGGLKIYRVLMQTSLGNSQCEVSWSPEGLPCDPNP